MPLGTSHLAGGWLQTLGSWGAVALATTHPTLAKLTLMKPWSLDGYLKFISYFNNNNNLLKCSRDWEGSD